MCDELCHDFYIEERQSFDAMVMGVSENWACPKQKGYDRAEELKRFRPWIVNEGLQPL